MLQRIFIGVYSLCILSLLGRLSLWVDEILQLMGTRSGTFSHINIAIATGIGGVPLAWLTQIASIRLFGYSVESARLPSALFSIGCCFLISRIARQLSLQNGTLAVCLFAAMPLQFRYAIEARPYTQGLFFSLLTTVIYLELRERPRFLMILAYAVSVTLSLYSQPLSLLVPLGHMACGVGQKQNLRRLQIYLAFSLVLAILLFVPWYRYAAPIWRTAIADAPRGFYLPFKTPLIILREISGAGYIGSIMLIGFAAVAVINSRKGNLARLAICCIGSCLFGGLAIDARFGYFLAVRQFIFVVPFLALLAAEGMGNLRPQRDKYAAAAILALFLAYDWQWMTKPREDWHRAAVALDQETKEQTCIVAGNRNEIELFAFFVPRLAEKRCAEPTRAYKRFVVVQTPYAPPSPQPSGFKCLKREKVGGMALSTYSF